MKGFKLDYDTGSYVKNFNKFRKAPANSQFQPRVHHNY